MRNGEASGGGGDDRRLREALQGLVGATDDGAVLGAARRRAARRQRHTRMGGLASVAAVVVGSLTAASILTWGGGQSSTVTAGSSAGTAGSAAAGRSPVTLPDSTQITEDSGLAKPGPSASGSSRFGDVGSCPASVPVPTVVDGRSCSPPSPGGTGSGPGGECVAGDRQPPCSAGVIPGRFYAYTMPGGCGTAVVFDGTRWVPAQGTLAVRTARRGWIWTVSPGLANFASPSGTGVETLVRAPRTGSAGCARGG